MGKLCVNYKIKKHSRKGASPSFVTHWNLVLVGQHSCCGLLFSISFLPWQISPAEQGGVGRNTIQSGFDFLFSSFPLSSFGLRMTEKEYKQNFSSRCPGILWRKHLFCKFYSVVLLPLKIFQPPVPRKRQAFGAIVCNAGKAAPVKNRSRILLPLQ